jgi:protein-tyrosine phosphatase
VELFTIARDGAGTLNTKGMPASYDVLADEEAAARSAGLAFHRLPIVDFGVPDPGQARALVGEVGEALADGEHVVIHCRGGIGRSSVVAAAVLVAEGATPDDAWSRLEAARGFPVPETDEQRDFVTGSTPEPAPPRTA